MTLPLMPKATAIWLVENTALTFKQIADFCGMHELEIKGIADGEVGMGIKGLNPISTNQLTKEEIDKAANDTEHSLELIQNEITIQTERDPKQKKYTPLSKRQERPDAISWLLRNHPELKDSQVAKLVGSTKNMVVSIKNKTNWKNDLLYYELEKTCLNMGCVSDAGEDFEELVPKYSKKTEDMNKNSINHTPYYPSKCFQTKNYKDYMFDDSGEGDGAEEAMEKKKEFIEKAIELMTEKLESDDNAGTFDTLLKTSISSARNEIYKKAGKKPFQFSKDFNNNILKDFARRNNKYPGIPEMTFRLYKLDQNNNEFKSLFHYMPWGDMLLTQEYVLNEGEIIRMDDNVVNKDTLNVSINQLAFKSYNNRFEIKIKGNGILTVYDNGRDIGALNGAQSINMSAFKNRVLKCELNNIHIYGEDVHEQNDNRGTVQLTIKDSKARIPSSIIVDPRNGSLVIYDLGFNVVN